MSDKCNPWVISAVTESLERQFWYRALPWELKSRAIDKAVAVIYDRMRSERLLIVHEVLMEWSR